MFDKQRVPVLLHCTDGRGPRPSQPDSPLASQPASVQTTHTKILYIYIREVYVCML